MKTYAVILEPDLSGKLSVPCGSTHYVQLDGRLSPASALNEAIDYFTPRFPTTKHIAVYKAPSIGARGRVVATFPHGRANVYEPVINAGCYK